NLDGTQVSPDGKWVAYSSSTNTSVASFPSLANPAPISQDLACQPKWRRDGKELFFLNPRTNDLMSVAVKSGEGFAAEAPRMLFHTPLTIVGSASQYAVSSDGQRIYIFQPEAQASLTDFHVAVNWPQLLKK